MQWHPIFAHLLRALLQDYYEIRTDLPVGDLPRQADIVLLRRTAPAPFIGLWRHLTTWNVFEFKGPSDDPALRDLDLLFEVGLGIDRRLNEDRQQQGTAALDRGEVSWWYLANHIGRRFRAEAERLLGQPLQELGAGLWRCMALGRVLFLVSRDALPVERESVPLHLVTGETVERQLEVARVLVGPPGLRVEYETWLTFLHETVSKETSQMIRDITKEPFPDLESLVDHVENWKFLDEETMRQIVEKVGLKKIVDQVGLEKIIEKVGLKKIVDQVGLKQIVDTVGLDALLGQLTPEQLQELKRRLP